MGVLLSAAVLVPAQANASPHAKARAAAACSWYTIDSKSWVVKTHGISCWDAARELKTLRRSGSGIRVDDWSCRRDGTASLRGRSFKRYRCNLAGDFVKKTMWVTIR
jgi:hypothetical protein